MKTIAEILDMVEAYGRLNQCGDFHGLLADIERAIKDREALADARLDRAFQAEIDRVSHVEYDSNEICRHFYKNVRKRFTEGAAS